MMKDWSYMYDTAIPTWASNYFKGLDMSKNNSHISVHNLEVNDIDFSFSTFKNLSFNNCDLSHTKFNNCSFLEFELKGNIYGSTFNDLIKIENSIIYPQYDYLPVNLMCHFFPNDRGIGVSRKPLISNQVDIYWNDPHNHSNDDIDNDTITDVFDAVKGFFIYGIKENIFTTETIIDSYNYNSEETKEIFSDMVKKLK